MAAMVATTSEMLEPRPEMCRSADVSNRRRPLLGARLSVTLAVRCAAAGRMLMMAVRMSARRASLRVSTPATVIVLLS